MSKIKDKMNTQKYPIMKDSEGRVLKEVLYLPSHRPPLWSFSL